MKFKDLPLNARFAFWSTFYKRDCFFVKIRMDDEFGNAKWDDVVSTQKCVFDPDTEVRQVRAEK